MDFMYAGPIANTVWCSTSPCSWATLANDRVWTESILNHKIGLAASEAARSIILNAEWKQVTECVHTECTHTQTCMLALSYYIFI
jgi:mannose/fructose/N-acetylgalactosamine-specific phosphotransferase system component IIB